MRYLTLEHYRQTLVTYSSLEACARFHETQSEARGNVFQGLLEEFAQTLKVGKVLDLGCGTGVDVGALRQRGFDAFGIDSSSCLIRYAVDKFGPHFRVFDIRRCQEFGRCFDGVLCIFSLIHFPWSEWLKILTSANSVLLSGGVLLLSVKEGKGVLCDKRLGRDFPRFVQLCSSDDVEPLLLSAGFADLDFRHSQGNPVPWLHVFARNGQAVGGGGTPGTMIGTFSPQTEGYI